MRFLAGLGIRAKRTDPVVLSVSEVRNEVLASSQGDWRARNTSRLLSRIFHESITELFRVGPRNWMRSLTAADFEDTGNLERHVFEYFVGHRLTRYQGALKEQTDDVLQFWTAMKEWCEWFRVVVQTGLRDGHLQFDEETGMWGGTDGLVEPDRHLKYTFEDPQWTAPVMIQGRADAVIRKPGTNDWFVTEYRAGAGATDADLAEAVMFSLMLDGPAESRITLVRLDPKVTEVSYTNQELKAGVNGLKSIVCQLAGVLNLDGSLELTPTSAEPDDVSGGHSDPAPGAGSQQLARLAGTEVAALNLTAEKIVNVCREFGAEVTLVSPPAAGSTFIRYQLNPEQGLSKRKLTSLALDLQIRLGLETSPLIRVDRGKLVIDVPRQDRQGVTFASVRHQLPRTEISSRMPLGVDLLGSLKFADLANPVSAHLLVAGTAGSGKTEWLRMAMTGLMLQNTPASLRFALVDAKGGAFSDLQNSPFLWTQEQGAVVPLLSSLIEEMDRRYRLMGDEGVLDVANLPAKARLACPRIVFICDEYADLVAHRGDRREIEERIAVLGGKARAAGIHLVIATQRPSRDILDGALRANLAAKVALKTNSSIESRLVLGVPGAESLLGEGDLLYQDAGGPVRLQAPLLSSTDRAEWMAPAALGA